MLYDIEEQDNSSAQRETAIGIDLGTTFSLAAIVLDEAVEMIPQQQGDINGFKLPSVVYYPKDHTPVVGYDAIQFKDRGAIFSIKRFVGSRTRASVGFSYEVSYELALKVSTDILLRLKASAEEYLARSVSSCVITVPAYFDDSARALTKTAAEHAGFKVLRMLSEPTAAALAYGVDQQVKGTIAVYDLGGGTFDVTILKMKMGVYQVLATCGNNCLGGDDFDHIMLEIIAKKLNSSVEELGKSHEILLIARSIRESLTDNLVYDGVIGVLGGTSIEVTREEFTARARPMIETTINIFRKALNDAGIIADELDEVLLVGGATRMPQVADLIRQHIGKDPLSSMDPDYAVVKGAAIQAARLSHDKTDGLLIDVIPLSLGIELADGSVEKIIYRNLPIPMEFKKLFTTGIDGQTSISIHIVQGEKQHASQCRSLGNSILMAFRQCLLGPHAWK